MSTKIASTGYLGALYRWSQKSVSADLRTELHTVVDIVVSGVGRTRGRETSEQHHGT